MTDTQSLIAELDRIAGDAAKPGYFIFGEWHIETTLWNFYSTEAFDYCHRCAHRISNGLYFGLLIGWDDENVVANIGPCSENDGCRHCAICGQLLQYRLTDEGAASELDHFTEFGIGELTPDTAYHLARMVEAAPEEGIAFLKAYEASNAE